MIILGMGSDNERRRYIATSLLIDWVHIQNDPWVLTGFMRLNRPYSTGHQSHFIGALVAAKATLKGMGYSVGTNLQQNTKKRETCACFLAWTVDVSRFLCQCRARFLVWAWAATAV